MSKEEYYTEEELKVFDDLMIKVQRLKRINELQAEKITLLEECRGFYASEYSWIRRWGTCCDLISEKDIEQLECSRGLDWNTGGKLARETAEKCREIDAKIEELTNE